MAETLDTEMKTLEEDEVTNGGRAESDMKSPTSSSDSDSDDEDLKLETLEKELSENPSSYDAHVQYIKAMRKLGRIEKLREARESMSELFPLSPTMWQEWAKDEASLSTGSEAFAAIEKLYERGVQDYLENDQAVAHCTPAGILKMRDLFERALTAAGLHILEGNKIWEAYREFEQAILLTIDETGSEEKRKQVHRIRSLFHRQLSVPLADSGSTLLAYKHWEAEQGNIIEVNSDALDGIPSHIISAYQRAMQMYDARAHYEDQLSNRDSSDAERLQQFMTYIKFEESSGDPVRTQILYERAVAEFPISSDLWLAYTRYLDKTLKVPNVLRAVYSRATRNCTWIGELWARYMLSLERFCAPEKELSAVFEKSLQCAFSSIEEYMNLFLIRIDSLRRRISVAIVVEDGLDYALIRDTFQRAAEYLSPHLKNMEGLLRLHSYWARLEFNIGKDLVAARGVWESLIKTSGSMLEVWQCYIAMEIEGGHLNEARSIYKRCYSKRFLGTGSEDICHSWLRFEREFGTLEDFDHAERKVTPRLEELQLFRLQQETKSSAVLTAQKENPLKAASQKRKTSVRFIDEQPPSKRQKDSAQKQKQDFGKYTDQKDTAHKSTEVNDTVPLNVSDAAPLPTTIKPEAANEQPVGDSTSTEANPNFYTDECTAFITNISLEAKEDHLRDFFSDGGGVTAIRLLRDKFTGRSRGLAYVDFSDDAHLAAAITKNRQKLLGQNLNIARSDPKQSKKRASSGSSTARGRGRGKLSGNDHGGSGESKRSAEVSKESRSHNAPSSVSHRRGGHVQLMERNTFAVPRAVVRPLGWSNNEPKVEQGEENPKSNDEFRKLLKK
ncbi:EMBRYO DEFECTIVE 140 isoform X2 [Tasmannia lanceolata]|uniref:EMBRYO DEFECTIVE 140 isoform X2 n=1 Tax=Tasmannia lanceolata TaxID=3420 RepID=UPI00406465B1